MKIITLGNCCGKSKKNHANAIIAAENCGVEPPENIGDIKEIIKYGVMATPALVIDGKVVASGSALSVGQIEKLIKSKQ